MIKTAEELRNESIIPVQIIKPVVDAIGTGWDKIATYVFPQKEIVLLKISPNRPNSFNLLFFDGMTEKAIIIPKDFPFEINTTDFGKKLKDTFFEYQIKSLPGQLAYPGAIGSDPEIFIENSKGEIIPAFKFLGSKENPDIAPDREYGANKLYWDGFQAEFTTFATTCMGWHADSIQCGLDGILAKAKKYDKTAKLSAKTVFDIPIELLRNSAPEHIAFGCMKSFNVYNMDGIQAPGSDVFYRSAGGHIHFGFLGNANPTVTPTGETPKKSQETINQIVKALDAILGVAGVSLFANYDDPRRRQMYGLAGEYRLPPHGLEYRTLSNAWLFHPLIANIIFDLARSTFMFGEKGFLKYWVGNEQETIETINNCDVATARKILSRNKSVFEKILQAKYWDARKVTFVYNAILNGMESVVESPTDIAKNWSLDGSHTWRTHCDGEGKNVSQAYLLGKKA